MSETLWQRYVSDTLDLPLWTADYVYDAGQYLILPLLKAFEHDKADWIADFRDHFTAFVDMGYSTDAGWTGQAQYAQLATQFMLGEQNQSGETTLTDAIFAQSLAMLTREWFTTDVEDWSGFAFTGRRESVLAKLSGGAYPVTDKDLYAVSLAADLALYQLRKGEAVDAGLLDILAIGDDIYDQLGTFTDAGGWIFDPARWADHPDYVLAGWDGQSEIETQATHDQAALDALSWDISHAARFPYWLRSLSEFEAEQALGATPYADIMAALSVQFESRVLREITPGAWGTTNYLDGSDGVYRFDYNSFADGDGYAPGQLSGTFLLGGWSLLGGAVTAQSYSELSADQGFTPAMLESFHEPLRQTATSGLFDWRTLIESGDIRLWTGLASGLTEFGPPAVFASITAPIVLGVGAAMTLADILSGVDLTDVTHVEIYDAGGRETSGHLQSAEGALTAKQVHSVSVDDLSSISFVAGDPIGERLYWRTVEAEATSLWTSVEIRRYDSGVSDILSPNLIFEQGAFIDLGDKFDVYDGDGDAPLFYEFYTNTDNAIFIDGTAIDVNTDTLITAAQLGTVTTRIDADAAYWVRAQDGLAWTAWTQLPIGVSAPDRVVARHTDLALGEWRRLSDVLDIGEDVSALSLWNGFDGSAATELWREGEGFLARNQSVEINLDGLESYWVYSGSQFANIAPFWFSANNGAWTRFDIRGYDDWNVYITDPLQIVRTGDWLRLTDITNTAGSFEIWDVNPDDSTVRLWIEGQGFVDAAETIEITPLEAAKAWIYTGDIAAFNRLYIRELFAVDQDWKAVEIDSRSAPDIALSLGLQASGRWVRIGAQFELSADATHIELWDDSDGGHSLWTADGGTLSFGQGHVMSVDDLGDVWMQMSQGQETETLWFRALTDGVASAWNRIDISARPAPQISGDDITTSVTAQIDLSDSFVFSDTVSRVQIWDEDGNAIGSRFSVNGFDDFTANTSHTLTRSEWDAALLIASDHVSVETVWLRAYDGLWSDWFAVEVSVT